MKIIKIPCKKSISLGWDCNKGHLCDKCKMINLLQITKQLYEMEERLELWFKVEELEQELKELLKLNKGK
jgi:hypothetical protein